MSSGRAGQVTAVDAGVTFLRTADDEHRQGAVVRPVDPVTAVGHDQTLAAGDRSSVHGNTVDVGRRRSGPRHSA